MPPELRRSTSLSRQFIIYAHDGARRAAFSRFAEDTRAALHGLLGVQDAWRLPIVVHLVRPTPGVPGELPASRLLLAQTGAGLKVQLDLRLDPGGASGEAGADLVRPRDELVRALLLELAYRDRPELPAGRAFQRPPAWLVEGCAAAVEHALAAGNRGDATTGLVSSEIGSALRAATQRDRALPLEKFLSREPAGLDSPSRALYRAYAFGLVHLLTAELPGGKTGLMAFLRALPAAEGASQTGLEALRWYLPAAAGDGAGDLQTRWSATMARLAAAETFFETFGLEESERRLAAALEIQVPLGGTGSVSNAVATSTGTSRGNTKPPTPAVKTAAAPAERTVSLEEFETFLRPGRRHARENAARLGALRAGLLVLTAQAHPGYQNIVAGYGAVVSALGAGRFEGVRDQLRQLAQARAETRTRHEAVADYLNWFEATQLHTPSGTFEPYFRFGQSLDRIAPRARRTDAISTYLDGLEHEFR